MNDWNDWTISLRWYKNYLQLKMWGEGGVTNCQEKKP